MFYFLRMPSSCNFSLLPSPSLFLPPFVPRPLPSISHAGLELQILQPVYLLALQMFLTSPGFFIFIFDDFWKFSADLCVVFVSPKSPFLPISVAVSPVGTILPCLLIGALFIYIKGGHLNVHRASVDCGRDLLLSL